MITSGCRAQLLDLITLHKDRSQVLMVATDGAFSTGKYIKVPIPRDTGTAVKNRDGKILPLGGWECGDIPQGIFAARPGIYFPLNPTKDDIKKVKGRGVGKGTILDNHKLIVDTFRLHGITKTVAVKDIERFCGGKTSISWSPARKTCTRAAGGVGEHGQQLPKYGEWILRRVEMAFDPLPKRAGVLPDGIHLRLRKMDPWVTSVAYSKALRSQDALKLDAETDEIAEQKDADFAECQGEFGDWGEGVE